MTSKAEMIGAALAKAVKKTAAQMKSGDEAAKPATPKPATPMYRTNMRDVPKVDGLKRQDGWVDMQVQFLVDERTAGTDQLVFGRTVLRPGARHERHRHPRCDEFLLVLSEQVEVYTDEGREPSSAGDVVFTPAGHWHGFDNTGDEDVLLIWGWMGAGSIEASGYEVPTEGHKS